MTKAIVLKVLVLPPNLWLRSFRFPAFLRPARLGPSAEPGGRMAIGLAASPIDPALVS